LFCRACAGGQAKREKGERDKREKVERKDQRKEHEGEGGAGRKRGVQNMGSPILVYLLTEKVTSGAGIMWHSLKSTFLGDSTPCWVVTLYLSLFLEIGWYHCTRASWKVSPFGFEISKKSLHCPIQVSFPSPQQEKLLNVSLPWKLGLA